ncbi:MAG: lipopolysaccharide assembly protein LapA domain-containing protein [Candidatus Methanosuratincola sp.]|jgi:uncharacterized membrane protein YciS (DUF1049 family)
MRYIGIIIKGVIFVLAITLVLQNQEVFTYKFPLTLDLRFYQVGPYLTMNIVIVGASFLLGVLLAVIWGALHSLSSISDLRRARRRIRELEEEIERLSARGTEARPEEEKAVLPWTGHSQNPFAPPPKEDKPEL